MSEFFYAYKSDVAEIIPKLDLGDSRELRVIQYPLNIELPHLMKFIEVTSIQAKNISPDLVNLSQLPDNTYQNEQISHDHSKMQQKITELEAENKECISRYLHEKRMEQSQNTIDALQIGIDQLQKQLDEKQQRKINE